MKTKIAHAAAPASVGLVPPLGFTGTRTYVHVYVRTDGRTYIHMYARQAASEWTSKVRGGYEGRSGRDCGRGYGVAEGLCTYVCT